MMDLGGTLLLVKARSIFPFELVVCDISLAFQMILWFLSETAMGMDLTSSLIRN